ncbi:MAG: hypothetical protein H6729_00145, partial [Deltaproteobacteria bacterium]|nr:hypothetical protein [Deltaproteobacteria bacterium]
MTLRVGSGIDLRGAGVASTEAKSKNAIKVSPNASKTSVGAKSSDTRVSAKQTTGAKPSSTGKKADSKTSSGAGEKASSAGEKASSAGEKASSATGEKPSSATGEKPSSAGERPSSAGVSPGAGEKASSATGGKPSSAGEKPSRVGEKLSGVGERPSSGAKPSSNVKPSDGAKPSGEKASSTGAKPASAAGAKPSSTGAKPASAAGAKPSSTSSKPASAEDTSTRDDDKVGQALRRASPWFSSRAESWPKTDSTIERMIREGVPDEKVLSRLERSFLEDTRHVTIENARDGKYWLPKEAVWEGAVLVHVRSVGPRLAKVTQVDGPEIDGTLPYTSDDEILGGLLHDGILFLHKAYYREGATDHRNKPFDYILEGWSRIRHIGRVLGDDRVSLRWRDYKADDGREVHVARYRDGAFKIVATVGPSVLFYEWNDGTFRDLAQGNVDFLKWQAEHWLTRPVLKFRTFDEYLDAAKSPGGELRMPAAPEEATLKWSGSTKIGESIVYYAALARRGVFEVRRAKKGAPFKVYFKPVKGSIQRIGTTFGTSRKGKEAAQEKA